MESDECFQESEDLDLEFRRTYRVLSRIVSCFE